MTHAGRLAASVAAALTAPAAMAQSSTSGHARATVHWTCSHITPAGGSDYGVFDTHAGAYTCADLNTSQPVLHSDVDHGSQYPELAVSDAFNAGPRSYTLQSTVDLASAQIQSSDVASSNYSAGRHLDEATTSR